LRISTGKSLRISGSPPVMRSLVTPNETATLAKRSISSKERISRAAYISRRLRACSRSTGYCTGRHTDPEIVVDAIEGIDKWAGHALYFTASMRS